MRDPYDILQVAPHAEIEVIESAYRRLARKYHPDANPSGDASERMKDINWAYEILRDPLARANYDRGRRAAATSSPPDYAPHPRQPQSTPYRSAPPTPWKPSSAPPPLAPKTSLLQRYWFWIVLTIAAYFLIVQPQLRGSSPGASLDDSAAGDVSNNAQRDPYSDCIDWTAAHLYDGETKCVIGMIVVVTQQFDRATAADVWIAHFSYDTRSDFTLVSVDRDISEWQGKCVAVYGTLFDRDTIRDYAEDPQPGMVDSDPFDARGFTISAAPSNKCG